MSFGYSVGDFIAGANLSYRLIRVLVDTQGASLEYQEAIAELATLQQTFFQVGQMKPNATVSRATINAAAYIVLPSITLIDDFLAKTQRYRQKLSGSPSTNGISDSWQKMGWALFRKEELKALKEALHLKLTNIGILLATAQFHGPIPDRVAQYQDGVDKQKLDHIVENKDRAPERSSPPPPTYTARPQPVQNRSHSILNETHTVPVVVEAGESNLDTPDSTRGEDQIISPMVITPAENPIQREMTPILIPPEEVIPPPHNYTENQRPSADWAPAQFQYATQISPTDALAFGESDVNDEESIVKRVTQDVLNKPQSNREHPHPDTVAAGFTMISQLEKFLRQNSTVEHLEPLKFKDAVKRKFTFPFHLCSTWTGMEELIKQAFMHVDILGAHVAEGHYDLIGEQGEIILPQVWETLIKPGMSITMHMWPMPEKKPPRPPPRLPGELQPPRARPPPWNPPAGAPSPSNFKDQPKLIVPSEAQTRRDAREPNTSSGIGTNKSPVIVMNRPASRHHIKPKWTRSISPASSFLSDISVEENRHKLRNFIQKVNIFKSKGRQIADD